MSSHTTVAVALALSLLTLGCDPDTEPCFDNDICSLATPERLRFDGPGGAGIIAVGGSATYTLFNQQSDELFIEPIAVKGSDALVPFVNSSGQIRVEARNPGEAWIRVTELRSEVLYGRHRLSAEYATAATAQPYGEFVEPGEGFAFTHGSKVRIAPQNGGRHLL